VKDEDTRPVDAVDLSEAPATRRARRAAEQASSRNRVESRTGRRLGGRFRTPVAAVVVAGLAVAGLTTLALRDGGSDGFTPILADGPDLTPREGVLDASQSPTSGVTATGGTASGTATAGSRTATAAARAATRTAGATSGAAAKPGSGRTTGTSSTTKRAGAPSAVATPRLVAGGAPFATRCGVSSKLVPSCGAYWGIYSRRYGGGNVATTVTTWESKIGRQFDIVLMYYDFSGRNGPGQFPDAAMRSLGEDRILLFDWESRNFSTGANYRWADIAAGRYDASVVVPQAQRIKAYGKKVMLGLDHEMDLSHAKHGTAAEYKAAYKHLRSVFAAQGVNNVIWTWVTSGYVGYGNGPLVKSFYPGDAYVDWIGYDPYNFYTCHNSGWETFDQTVKGFYDWSAANGLGNKPLLIQEYGMKYGSDTQSRQWYRDIDDVLRKRTRIKALVRWDSDTSCTLRIDNGPGMVSEFAAAGKAIDRP
jgi:hypothetical protein